jgi:hypothetical protein
MLSDTPRTVLHRTTNHSEIKSWDDYAFTERESQDS